MSATDARRTEMELKVDQKVLCDEIEGQEEMEARMEKNLQAWGTKCQADVKKAFEHAQAAHADMYRQLKEALQKNLKLEQEKNTLQAKNAALTNHYADLVLKLAKEKPKSFTFFAADQERALAAADAAELNSRP